MVSTQQQQNTAKQKWCATFLEGNVESDVFHTNIWFYLVYNGDEHPQILTYIRMMMHNSPFSYYI